ncbi:MAG: hypothetical protein GC137_09240 [Alphaproteobacteria bacterium]|nr:hypothetical protein [Alphaproteobacteria bacterium]
MSEKVKDSDVMKDMLASHTVGVLLYGFIYSFSMMTGAELNDVRELFTALILPLFILAASYFFAFPAIILGYMAAKCMIERKLKSPVLWVLVSWMIGLGYGAFLFQISNFFGMFVFAFAIFCSPIIGYLMWSRTYRKKRDSLFVRWLKKD